MTAQTTSTPTAPSNTSSSPSMSTQQTTSPTLPGIEKIKPRDYAEEHRSVNLLDEENWLSWRTDIELAFRVCELKGYISGDLKCPDEANDPVGAANWRYNDDYTKKVIRDRLSVGQKYHTDNCDTSQQMWTNLEAIHQSRGYQTQNQLMRELNELKAKEGDDIPEHLAKITQLWNRIKRVCRGQKTEQDIKESIVYLLPASWDEFTRPFITHADRMNISIHGLIGECNEEYRRRQQRAKEEASETQSAYANTQNSKAPLAQRIGGCIQPKKANTTQTGRSCSHCGRDNHKSDDCYYYLKKPKCSHCGRLGHDKVSCRFKKKDTQNKSRKNKEKMVTEASSTKKEANAAETQANAAHVDTDEEILAAIGTEENMSVDQEDPFYDNLSQYNMHFVDMNENSRMYNWLADSGATHHISNTRNLFITYQPMPNAVIHGIGDKVIPVQGRGTVMLTAQYGTQKQTLRLEQVNHIPNNKYNILALGRWTSKGCTYKASNSGIILYNRYNEPVLEGQTIASHLCHFWLSPKDATQRPKPMYTLSAYEPKQS